MSGQAADSTAVRRALQAHTHFVVLRDNRNKFNKSVGCRQNDSGGGAMATGTNEQRQQQQTAVQFDEQKPKLRELKGSWEEHAFHAIVVCIVCSFIATVYMTICVLALEQTAISLEHSAEEK